MAKKKNTDRANDSNYQSRQSRKEELIERKNREQSRVVWVGVIVVGVLLLLLLLIPIVNELFIAPNATVASVNEQEIPMSDWQDRVVYERALRIITLETQLENFNNDVGLIQQFASQAILELIRENAEALGEAVLERMVDEAIIWQAAQDRGLIPADADVDERIGASFNFFGGDSPTPFPTAEPTIMPTPSLTPIVIAEAEEESGDEGDLLTGGSEGPLPPAEDLPTSTPFPTATPVSQESFQQELDDLLSQYRDFGVSEATYRQVIANAIAAERLTDALAEEKALSEDDMHASFFFLSFGSEEEANQALDDIAAEDFLTVWNTIRSTPPDPEAEPDAIPPSASEIVWRTRDGVAAAFNEEIAENAFTLPLETPSGVLTISGVEGQAGNFIILVSGREERPLSDGEYQQRKQQLLADFITESRAEQTVAIGESWRSRVPRSPILDPKFRQPPTPVPGVEEGALDLEGLSTP